MSGEHLNVAAQLEQLRGAMNTGFAKLEGQLGLLVERTDSTRSDLESLEGRVSALEARRWPLGPIAVFSGAVSAVVAVMALFLGQG